MRSLMRRLCSLTLSAALAFSQVVVAADLTNHAENKLIDALFRGQSLGAPATLYFSLHTAACSDSSTGTEVTGGSYARQGIAGSLTNFAGTQSAGSTTASSGTGGTTSNNVAIVWATAPTANWGTVTHIGIFDASTSGNMWLCKALTASKTINNGDPAPKFAIGAFTFQIDN